MADKLDISEARPQIRKYGYRQSVALEGAQNELSKVKIDSHVDTNVTGLPNDKALNEMLAGLQNKWERENEPGVKGAIGGGTFIILDTDHLHDINFKYGKKAGGDDVLRAIRTALLKRKRLEDRVFRDSDAADEFVFHTPEPLTPVQAGEVMNGFDLILHEEQEQYQEKYPGIRIGVSYCIANYGGAISPQRAYNAASNKMGEAKKSTSGGRVGNVGRIFVILEHTKNV